MKIRAKMTVSEITRTSYGTERAKLNAVYSSTNNSEDNNYSKATPSANLEISIDNPAAQGILIPGKSFYVDLTPADPIVWSQKLPGGIPESV